MFITAYKLMIWIKSTPPHSHTSCDCRGASRLYPPPQSLSSALPWQPWHSLAAGPPVRLCWSHWSPQHRQHGWVPPCNVRSLQGATQRGGMQFLGCWCGSQWTCCPQMWCWMHSYRCEGTGFNPSSDNGALSDPLATIYGLNNCQKLVIVK